MALPWKIVVCSASIAAVFGLSVAFWLHEKRAVERKMGSDAASVSRAHAEQGDAKAEFDLAFMYYHGRGVPQDYTEAVYWCRKAADQDYAKAQFELGRMYQDGKGVPQDYIEARRWYLKTAEQGDPNSESALGYL